VHKYRAEEKKISKNNSFVIPKVSRYDYIRIIRWAGLVARMYTVIKILFENNRWDKTSVDIST